MPMTIEWKRLRRAERLNAGSKQYSSVEMQRGVGMRRNGQGGPEHGSSDGEIDRGELESPSRTSLCIYSIPDRTTREGT